MYSRESNSSQKTTGVVPPRTRSRTWSKGRRRRPTTTTTSILPNVAQGTSSTRVLDPKRSLPPPVSARTGAGFGEGVRRGSLDRGCRSPSPGPPEVLLEGSRPASTDAGPTGGGDVVGLHGCFSGRFGLRRFDEFGLLQADDFPCRPCYCALARRGTRQRGAPTPSGPRARRTAGPASRSAGPWWAEFHCSRATELVPGSRKLHGEYRHDCRAGPERCGSLSDGNARGD